ncbi:hypothetical protein B0H16DRAFT_1733835 [Mycena metata]|uniref:Uncharacterized protein n=1 Tax=Mycena metata TaxID=1033252 RepID=A0AAD7HZ29_9AGAR|nr:hypothetical protein B0H16DRAFT_1733835 [Mycena metata]
MARLLTKTPEVFQNATFIDDNFVGISLSRTDDLEGTADASVTINELDPTYSAVANAPPIQILAGIVDRWRIPVDSISVDGVDVPFLHRRYPTLLMEAWLRSWTQGPRRPPCLPRSFLQSSQIPGAIFKVVDGLQDTELWTVPCNTTTIVSVGMGGKGKLPPLTPLAAGGRQGAAARAALGAAASRRE